MRHFPHHIGDYAAATAHLSFVEDAAYHRLLRVYYRDERPLPAELGACQRIVGARTREERMAVETVLAEFFRLGSDGWRQRRADEELTAYRERTNRARKNGQRGGRPKTQTEPIQEPTDNPVGYSWVSQTEPREKLTINHKPITNNQMTPASGTVCVSDSARAREHTQPIGRAMPISEGWEPSEAALIRLRIGRPDLIGEFYDRRMTAFRLWLREKAVTTHDFEATWLKFMLQSRLAGAGQVIDKTESWDQRRIRLGRAALATGEKTS